MVEGVKLLLQEVRSGQGASLAEIARMIPGRRVNTSTTFRWCTKGLTSADGSRVILEHIRVGGGNRIITTWPAVDRFFTALTIPADAPPPARSPAATKRAVVQAEAELDRMGA
jgi:hypothetical protein